MIEKSCRLPDGFLGEFVSADDDVSTLMDWDLMAYCFFGISIEISFHVV
jgi:hypothetical protein